VIIRQRFSAIGTWKLVNLGFGVTLATTLMILNERHPWDLVFAAILGAQLTVFGLVMLGRSASPASSGQLRG
jgi:hypothetical protein